MRRALLLLSGLATAAALAQPVATLEVVPKAKPLTQHQRIEKKLDRVLELLEARAAPPPPAPAPETPPAKPAEPAPADPAPPAGVDARIAAWCAEGLDLVQIRMWRLSRPLSAAEVEFAHASGCPKPGASTGGPVAPAPGPAATGPGFDLGTGGGSVRVNEVIAGGTYAFAFTVSPEKPSALLTFFGAPGQFFSRAAVRITNAAGGVVYDMPERAAAYVTEIHLRDLAPGRHIAAVRVNGTGRLGAQFQQRER